MNWKVFGIVTVCILCVIGMGGTGYVTYKVLHELFWPSGGRAMALARVRCNSQSAKISIAGCTTLLNNSASQPADRTYARFQRGLSYERNGDLDLAIQDDSAVIADNPREALAYNNRGFAYQRKGDIDHALADYDRAIQITPELSMAWFNRGEAHRMKEDYRQAIQDFSRVIQMQPKNAVAWNNRCYYRAIDGQLEAALSDCNRSLELRPGVPFVLDSRGFTYLKMKKYDLAVKDYDLAIAGNEKSSAYYYGRSLARQGLHDRAGAKEDLNVALKLEPGVAARFRKYGVS